MTSSLTVIIDLTRDINSIWKAIKKKRRGDINRALRLGMKVEINSNYDAWFALQHRNAIDKKCSYAQPERIKSQGVLFVAIYKDEVLAGEWFLMANPETIRTVYAASKHTTLGGLAHALEIWETIKYAKDKGYKYYDFGGYNLKFRTVSEWKLSFGGTVETG